MLRTFSADELFALKPNHCSETELAECLAAVGSKQDRTAFTALFQHYAPRITTYFRGLGMFPAAADDLTQETMLRLWSKAHLFDPTKGTPSGWVFTIARHLRITKLRERRLDSIDEILPLLEDPTPGPEGILSISDFEARIRSVLEDLPAAQADLLKAWFLEEKSQREIARSRNLPLGTVKSQMRRTMIRLRNALSEFQ